MSKRKTSKAAARPAADAALPLFDEIQVTIATGQIVRALSTMPPANVLRLAGLLDQLAQTPPMPAAKRKA